jgi:hypothetical protein
MTPRAPLEPDRLCGTIDEWDPLETSQGSSDAEWPRCPRLKRSRISSWRDSPKAAPEFRGRASVTRRPTDEARTSDQLASSCFGASDDVPRSLSQSRGQLQSLGTRSSARALPGCQPSQCTGELPMYRALIGPFPGPVRALVGFRYLYSPMSGFTLAGGDFWADFWVSKRIPGCRRCAERGIQRSKAPFPARCARLISVASCSDCTLANDGGTNRTRLGRMALVRETLHS